ncbi:MAG: hypothetical protein AABY86_06885, partial [Bdellovibrionota bacterium]
ARKVLTMVLKVNSVLFGDVEGEIHIRNVEKMLKLVLFINQDGVALRNKFKLLTKRNYLEQKDTIAREIMKISEFFLFNLQNGQRSDAQLDILELADAVKGIFNYQLVGIDSDLLRSVLFIKKLFLGGDQGILTQENIHNLFTKAPKIVMSILDFSMLDANELLENRATQYQFLIAINELERLRYPHNSDEIIVSHRELIALLSKMVAGKYDVNKLEEGLIHFKHKIIGGNPDWYSTFDISEIIALAREMVETLYFNSVTYDHFKTFIERPNIITTLERPFLPEYSIIPTSRVLKYWNIFEHMLTSYRFFTDETGRQIYGDYYDRHLAGVNRMAIMRIAFSRLIHAYGYPNPNGDLERYTHLLDKKRLKNFMYEYRGVLYELRLLSAELERTINEISMGADLFQAHSDDDFAINEDELTEYIGLILASNKVGREITKKLTSECLLIPGQNGGFDIPCYREQFYRVFFHELKLDRYFPKLYYYYVSGEASETWEHLLNLEGNSRIIADDRLPMTPVDINRLVTSFSQLESMIIRFDDNHNNYLDNVEVDTGYHHFKNIIMALAKLNEERDGIIKSIFLFLIKKKRIPKKVELLTFHIFENKKKITASRYTIGLVLANIINR